MDERNYQSRIDALVQQLKESLSEPELCDVLRTLLALFQEHHRAAVVLIDDYVRMTEDLTATVTRQTATVTHLTAAVEALTAERHTLVQAAADAYEAGLNEYLAYTNAFLEENQEAWVEYLRASTDVVVDPEALNGIDPRPPDTALRLCHACRNALE